MSIASAKFGSSKQFGDLQTRSQNVRIQDVTDVFKFPDGKWVSLRFVGPVAAYGGHWIKTKKKAGGETKFYKACLAFDPASETRDATKKCPWCASDSDLIQSSTEYYINAIVRPLQDQEPSRKTRLTAAEKETGFKEKDSESWTPIRLIRLTKSIAEELKRLSSLNRHRNKKTGETKAFPLSHPRYGVDVKIQYDPNEKTPAKKYTVQISERARPITEEEDAYLLQPLEDLLPLPKPEEEAKEYAGWAKRMGVGKHSKVDDDEDDGEEFDDEDDEDDEPRSSKSKSKKQVASKRKSRDEDEEDDDEDFDDDEEEDPPAKKAKPKSKKSKAQDDEEDDDEDFDDEDDDEPPRKSKSKTTAKKSKVQDDDEDFDDDEEDDDPPAKKSRPKSKKASEDDDEDFDDEDDDEPPRKSKTKATAKKSSKVQDEDEDEDFDDEDDEDEDERPAKRSSTKSKAKSRRAADDDEDEDDLDDDEEDEEDDPPPTRRKKPSSSKAAPKSRKSRSDDDDDDF